MSKTEDKTIPFGIRLVAALSEIKNPVCDASNTFYQGFRYATLLAIIEAAKPVLAKHGFAVVQPLSTDAEGRIWVRTILIDCVNATPDRNNGFVELGSIAFRPDPDKHHATGASLTYYRRYSLAAALGIVGDDDDDAETAVKDSREAAGSAARASKPSAPSGTVPGVARPAKPAEKPKAVSGLASTWPKVKIIRVTETDGEGQRGPWHRYGVLYSQNGAESWCATFDAEIGEKVKAAAADGTEVHIQLATAKSGRGVDLVAIKTPEEVANDDDDIPF